MRVKYLEAFAVITISQENAIYTLNWNTVFRKCKTCYNFYN